MSAPLPNVKVVEFGRFITAPYAAMLLADLGADVVKVESPNGDPFRAWPDGRSPRFAAYNRGKRSVVLEPRQDVGRRALHELIDGADVFVHNLRTSAVTALGIDYQSVARHNPGLVYCGIGGVGHPSSPLPAFDAIGQATSGLMSLLSPANGARPIGPALSDLITGVFAAHGIMAQLYSRAVSGAGGEVTVSMLSATSGLVAELLINEMMTGRPADSYTRTRNSLAFTLVGSDGGSFVTHLSTPHDFWVRLCTGLGAEELIDDPRFTDYGGRVAHYDKLEQELRRRAALRPRDEWLRRLSDAGAPCAPVHSISEILSDETLTGQVLAELHHGNGTGEPDRTVRRPVELPGSPALTREPRLGEHDVSTVLADWHRTTDSSTAHTV
jgi:crotonobetainyl-CoA:carnitine CoA-transferase CaiB-like acyl-CoA transferase